MTVGEVMSYHPIVAEPQMSVEEAAYLMKQQQIRRLPVVENNQLVGMLSLGALATLSDGLQSIEALKHISQP